MSKLDTLKCGHIAPDFDGHGNCITCARDKIANPLGDMFEAMGVKVVDITPRDQSVTETPNTLPTGTQEDDIECEIRDGICFSNQYPKHQCKPTQENVELRDGVILAIGRGNWERMHPTNRKKLLSLIQSHTNKARIDGAIMGAKFGNAAIRQYNIAGKPMNLDEIRDAGIKQAEDWAKRQC